MLDEYLELILNLEESVFTRVSEHFDHVAELRVQIIHDAELFVRERYLEINRSLFMRLCRTTLVLVGDEVFVHVEQGSTDTLLAREAANLPAQLYLERFDGLLAS